jgi:hypothetical protein
VADAAAAVTDTHALIFHASGGGRLGPKASAFFDAQPRSITYVVLPTTTSGRAQPFTGTASFDGRSEAVRDTVAAARQGRR